MHSLPTPHSAPETVLGTAGEPRVGKLKYIHNFSFIKNLLFFGLKKSFEIVFCYVAWTGPELMAQVILLSPEGLGYKGNHDGIGLIWRWPDSRLQPVGTKADCLLSIASVTKNGKFGAYSSTFPVCPQQSLSAWLS